MKPTPQLYEIPADATIQRCRSFRCQAPIVYITTPRGKKMPVTCATGHPHFADCVDAGHFRHTKNRHG